jgi:FlaA1/EpsC-like NDP-sugar epimerase
MNEVPRIGTLDGLSSWRRGGAPFSEPVEYGAGDAIVRRPRLRRATVLRRALMASDFVTLALAFVLARIDALALTLPAWLILLGVSGLYERDQRRTGHTTSLELRSLLGVITLGTCLLAAGCYVTRLEHPHVGQLGLFWLLALVLVPVGRVAARRTCRHLNLSEQNTLVIGTDEIAQAIARRLVAHPELGSKVVGFIDSNPRMRHPDLPDHLGILGSNDQVEEIVERFAVDHVVVSVSDDLTAELADRVFSLRDHGVQVDVIPGLSHLVSTHASVRLLDGIAVIGLPSPRFRRAPRVIRRMLAAVGRRGTSPA